MKHARRLPSTTRGRISLAIRILRDGRDKWSSREFDSCFECGDSKAVVRGIVAEARLDAALLRTLTREGLGCWLAEPSPQKSLPLSMS